jgi:hypothetical protein
MVFTVNWQHLARFAPKLAIGLGASAGMGYFINRTYCDSPSAIGSITVSAIDEIKSRNLDLSIPNVYTTSRFVESNDENVTFENLDGFTLIGVETIKSTPFTSWWAKEFVALYLHTETLNKLLESRWEDSSEATIYASEIMGEGFPMKLVTKTTTSDFKIKLYLDFRFQGYRDVLLSTAHLILWDERKKLLNDLNDLGSFVKSIPPGGTLKKGERLVVTKEADNSLTIDFPDRPDYSGVTIKNTEMSASWFYPVFGNEGSILFKKAH